MKMTLLLACVCLSTSPTFATSPADEYKLADGATIIETQPVTPNRSLILWMVRPSKHPRDTPADPYTCPEYTRGSYYSGATRVSLVDSQTRRVINTVKISSEPGEGSDEFDIPYNIRPDHYYHVEGAPKETEGKPTIIWLRDYNGDGKAWEFALFDAQACMGLATTLIGYSERQDKVMQYQTHLLVNDSKESVLPLQNIGRITYSAKSRRVRVPGSMRSIIEGGVARWTSMRFTTTNERRSLRAR